MSNHGGFILNPTPQECIACKVHAIPPPSGDLGFVFLSGFASGKNPDPRVQQHFIDSLCPRHKSAWEMIQNLDGGILHFLGLVGG